MPLAATGEMVDLRASLAVRSGTYLYQGPDTVTRWHSHNLHEVEYAFEGTVEIESASGHHLLPPHQAAWIPAGLVHRTTLQRVRSVSAFFDPGMVDVPDRLVRILAVTPLLREMFKYAGRWSIDRSYSDAASEAFLQALAYLTADALDHEMPLWLPVSDDPTVQEVMDYAQDHLAEVTIAGAASAVGISERTLRRRFDFAAGMSWSRYLRTARVLKAMALLIDPQRSVLGVSHEVGFDSISAFNRAFMHYAGENPSAYRRRVIAVPNAMVWRLPD
jgi:AraC-like DNA-binding protein